MAEVSTNKAYAPRVAAFTGWTILFFVLLRVAIGWHFLYEGIYKAKSGTFSSTPYLLASVGPFKPLFRGLVWDADGFERIKPEYIKGEIDARAKQIIEHYDLKGDQRTAFEAMVEAKKAEVDAIQSSEEFSLAVEDYKAQVAMYQKLLDRVSYQEKYNEPEFVTERLAYDQKKVDATRTQLLARAQKPLTDLDGFARALAAIDAKALKEAEEAAKAASQPVEAALAKVTLVGLTPEQLSRGPLPSLRMTKFPEKQISELSGGRIKFAPKTLTRWPDLLMMAGLTFTGACLVLGLFTRFAAFCAVLMLAMFYFSVPPWPGVMDPGGPSEGNYLIVNKNLIEMIACLMIMFSGVGRWFGLDAFLGAIGDRRRRNRAAAAAVVVRSTPADQVHGADTRSPAREATRV